METTAPALQSTSTPPPPDQSVCPRSRRLAMADSTRSPQRPCGRTACDSSTWISRRHAVASTGAALLGTGILLSPKGTTAHRVAGRVWAAVAVVTNLNSFRMRDSLGNLTWFHAASGIALASTAAGVYYARTKSVAKHKPLIGLAVAATAFAGAVAWATPNKRVSHRHERHAHADAVASLPKDPQ